jgi:predicted RNase H-like nuclease
MYVLGVDGCRDGWVAVALSQGRFAGATKVDSFQQLVDDTPDAVAIGVDIPIGLLPADIRLCDAMVRQFVGPRRNSVFQVPPRRSLEAESYEQANETSRTLTGKGVTKQAFNLRRKVLEVDGVVRISDHDERKKAESQGRSKRGVRSTIDPNSREGLKKFARVIPPGRANLPTEVPGAAAPNLPGGRIVEVHPEASFCEMNGQPIEFSKKAYNGMMMRMRLLEREGIVIPSELGAIGKVAVDDVLDAAAVAWTTQRYGRGLARTLPPEHLWQHEGDRVVAIWI